MNVKLLPFVCLAVLITGCRPSPPEIVASLPEEEASEVEAEAEAGTLPPANDEANVAMIRKFKSIVIPKIEFVHTPFEDAVAFLVQRGRELDPEGAGINVVMGPDLDAEKKAFQVTLNLSNVPLSAALAYTADLVGAKMTLEDHAVVLGVGTGNPLENALLFVEPEEAEAFREKLTTLIVPEIEFQETPLFDALEFLRTRAMELDIDTPEARRGVDLVLAVPPESGINPGKLTISLKLTKVSLEAAFRYTAELAGLEYRVEGTYVVISAPKAH